MLISMSLAAIRDVEVSGRDRLIVGPSVYRVVAWDEKNRRLMLEFVGDSPTGPPPTSETSLPSRSAVPGKNLYDALSG